jgi:hypothetical protein
VPKVHVSGKFVGLCYKQQMLASKLPAAKASAYLVKGCGPGQAVADYP